MQTAQRAFIALAALALTVGAAQVLATQQQEPAPAPATAMQGELVSVDSDAKTLTIKAADGAEVEFSYTDETEVSGAQEGVAGLATKTGSQVSVHYTEEGGSKTATRIEILSGQ